MSTDQADLRLDVHALTVLDGARLAYVEAGPSRSTALVGGGPVPIIFVHGWCGDHRALAPQIRFFSTLHRVLAPDLRGHGVSGAPVQAYTVASYADDLAWLIEQLGVTRPFVVGHSMGGTIALELAARHPDLLSGFMMIDSVLFPPLPLRQSLAAIVGALGGKGGRAVIRSLLDGLFLETDDTAHKAMVLEMAAATPMHVAASAFAEHLLRYDPAEATRTIAVPAAYVAAARPLADIAALCAALPGLATAQTLGAGHFSPLEVPDQINAMIARFIAMLPGASG